MKIVVGAIAAALTMCSSWAQSGVNWSILPNVRTGAPNEDLTFFATIVNGSDVEMDCQPRFGGNFTRPGGVSGQARFFTYDGTNVGASFNQVITIAPGGRQDYVVSLSVNRAYSGNIVIPLACTNPDEILIDLPRIPLANDFNVTIQSGNPPDIIMVSDTLSRDGVARVGDTGPRAALMTVAAVNIGGDATDHVIFPQVSGFTALHDGFQPTICEIDAGGICTGPEAGFIEVTDWTTNEVRTFAVRMRVPAELGVPFYPDSLRLRAAVANTNDAILDGIIDPERDIGLFFGETSVAPDVERHANAPAGTTPVQQCLYDQTGDIGQSFGRTEGMIVVTDNSFSNVEPGTGLGYFRQSDNQFDSRFRDLTPIGFSLPESGTGPADITVFGMGAGSVQSQDRTANAQITTAPDGSLRITWNANPGFSNDFEVAGRVRCAGAPALPRQPQPITTESLAESYGLDPSLGGAELLEEISWRNGTAESGELTRLYGDPANNVADAIMGAFVIFSGGRPGVPPQSVDGSQVIEDGEAIGILVPSRFTNPQSGSAQIECGTLMLTGVQENEETASVSNASISIMTLTGVEFEDVQRDCVR